MHHFSWKQYSGKQRRTTFRFIDFVRLAEELTDLHVHVNKESIAPLKRITNVSIICDMLKTKITSRRCLPEINMFSKVYCSVALTSASAERSFSVMRCIKIRLRNTMSDTDSNLNNQMFLNMQRSYWTKLICKKRHVNSFKVAKRAKIISKSSPSPYVSGLW